jgi:hypothetical protein
MSQNPYQPPEAPVAGADRDERFGSPVKAILFGLAIDIGGSFVGGTILVIAWGILLGAGGASGEEISGFFNNSDTFQWASLCTGLAFTGFGAYVAARIANRGEYRIALMLGLCSLAFGELMLRMLSGGAYPEWARLVGNLAILPVAFLGGHLRVLEKERRTRPTAS